MFMQCLMAVLCVDTGGEQTFTLKEPAALMRGEKERKVELKYRLGEDDESSWRGGSERKVATCEGVELASGRLMEKDRSDKSLLPGGRYNSRNA